MRAQFGDPELGPCPVCGADDCAHTDVIPWGLPVPDIEQPYTIPENVIRDDRIAYAVNEQIPWELAVAEGFVKPKTEPKPKPKGARKGTSRARRPAEDRAHKPEADR